MNRPAEYGEFGFTLVEVLVALTILSVSLAALLQIMGTNLDRLRTGRDEATALSLTQSILAEAGTAIPLRTGDTGGEFENGFRWRLHVEPYGDAEDRRAWSAGAVLLTASTLWDGDRRSVTLSLLRLAPKDSP